MNILLYIDDKIISQLNIEWGKLLSLIRKAVLIMHSGDYSQPIKPYLRYGNTQNRIIAMPAYLGGDVCISGIKWIASFPSNIDIGLPRAHCTIVLNESTTGVPLAVFNSAKISGLRTAAVSGTIIEEYVKNKQGKKFKVGIIGWGPIGKYHYSMVNEYFSNYIDEITIYDIKSIQNLDEINSYQKIYTTISNSWETLYNTSNIIITCTVSSSPYIDIEPNKDALLLNVSLRDYKSSIYKWVKDSIIVDDWDEVCRENTDIENMHKEWGLSKNDTIDMYDVLFASKLSNRITRPIMFNPMGLAIFDMIVFHHYYQLFLGSGNGIIL